LQLGHQLRVLAVRRDDHAQPPGQFQRAVQFAIVDAKGALVRRNTVM
jgi:hypothetical protein